MFFFSSTTRRVLAALADILEQPDQANTLPSSNVPLLGRVLASVEALLRERQDLKEQTRTLALDAAKLRDQLSAHEALAQRMEARWALMSHGAGELFWTLELNGTASPGPDCAMAWTGRSSFEPQGIDQWGAGSIRCTRRIVNRFRKRLPRT